MTANPEPSYAPWPPPGLEPVHGKFDPLITLLAVADLLLVVPLLAAVGTPGPFWSTGPFGGIWWMLLLTTVIGLAVLIAAAIELIRFLRAAAAGAAQGHGWRTILLVASDDSRDTGFVLQGGRAYVGMSRQARDTILAARLIATAGMILAGGLMPLGFALSLVVARLNWAGPGFLWVASLWLPVVFLATGLIARTADRLLTRAVRRDRERRQAAEQQVRTEIADWNRRIRDSSAYVRVGTGAPTKGIFRTGAFVVAGIAVLVIVPVTLLAVAGTIGSVMAEIGLPSISNVRARMAAAQLLRRYRLEADPRISADSAGASLHVLLSAGQGANPLPAFERQPVRQFSDPWWPDGPLQTRLTTAAQQADSLFSLIRRATPQERAYFARVASHPAHGEFTVVARAGAMDAASTRWVLPFPDSLNSLALPLPRFAPIRAGARAHVVRAVLHSLAGDQRTAEREVREVISTGFAMMDHGTTLIETLFGAVIVRYGGESLEQLYRMTGRQREAETLNWALTDARDMTQALARSVPSRGVEGELRRIAETVTDTTAPAGMRWELFGLVNAFAPCASLNRIVYGPDATHAEWMASARASLVRGAGDEDLFRLYQRGILRDGCFPGRQFIGMFRAM